MSPHATKIVFKFDAMPKTPEKDEISRKYCTDEINVFEFLSLAEKYIEEQTP